MGNTGDRRFRALSLFIAVSLIIGIIPWQTLIADSLTHAEFDCSPLSIVYDQNSTWGNYTQGQYTITNTSAYNVTSWTLEVEFSGEVSVDNIWNISNATESDSSTLLTLTSGTTIHSGSTYSFGMILVGSESAPTAPISITLTNVETDEPIPTPTPTPPPTVTVTPIPTEEPTATPTITDPPTTTPTNTPSPTDEPTPTATPTGTTMPTPMEPTVTPTPIPTNEPTPSIVPTITSSPSPSGSFPYAIFAENRFSFQGWKSTIDGDVYSGRDVAFSGSELSLNGTLESNGHIETNEQIFVRNQITPAVPISVPNWGTPICKYSDIYNEIDPELFNSQESIIVEGYYYVNGNLTINATNFIGNAVIVASGNIIYNVDSFECNGRLVLCSENGNIIINGSNIELNGIYYAPNGNIAINAYNTTVKGRIVAQNVNYQGSILNVLASENDVDFLYDYPSVSITTSVEQAEIGDTIVFQVLVGNNENDYAIHYKMNGESIVIPENNQVSIIAETARAYVLEAFITLDDGSEVLIGRASVLVIDNTIPSPTPSIEPTTAPTATPIPTNEPTTYPTTTSMPTSVPTTTPVPSVTDIPDDGDVRIILNTDGFISTESGYFFYINDEVSTVSGQLYGFSKVKSFSYAISSSTVENYKTGTIDIQSNWETNDIGFFYGPTKLVLTAETEDDELVSETFVFFCLNDLNTRPFGINPDLDSDSDGLSDYIEQTIGTSENSADSDNDGVPDVVELFFGFTDASDEDSDDNGINDGHEDLDEDGLNYLEEFTAGTLFINPDTDGDKLTDGEEVNIYHTDPLVTDSDDDGISDYEEVKIGKNPNSPDAGAVTQTATMDIEDSVIETIGISFSNKHYLDEYVSADNLLNASVPMTNVVGRVGAPFELSSQLEFDSATVTITYDETKLGDTSESDLGVVWYDEANGYFVLQDQAILNTSNNTITLELSHFSKYAVVDVEAYNSAWIDTPDYNAYSESTNERYDYIFMIECSVFMEQYKERAREVMGEFINNMRNGDRCGFGIVYGSGVQYYNVFATSKSSARSWMNNILTYSSEAMSYDVGAAVEGMERILDSNEDVGNIPVLINVTSNVQMFYNYSLDVCENRGVRVYAAIMGVIDGWEFYSDDSHYNLYEELDYDFDYLMAQTHGYRLHGFTGEEMYNDFKYGLEIDSDEDGIPDVYEQLGIRIRTGQLIYTNPNSQDSDGDGINDWSEYGFDAYHKQYPFFRNLVEGLPQYNGMWYVPTNLSPAVLDNDNDGLFDSTIRWINSDNWLPVDEDPETINAPVGLLDQYCDDIATDVKIARNTTSSQAPFAGPDLNVNINWKTATGEQKKQAVLEIWNRLCTWFNDQDNRDALLAFIGCFTLGFYDDNLDIAAHSIFDQIQRPFGYCDLYDYVFRIGTKGNMRVFKPGDFKHNNKDYIFWGWRGDYLNLGSGGEVGFYCDPAGLQQLLNSLNGFLRKYSGSVANNINLESMMWWSVAEYELPMRMSIYNKTSGGYDSVLSWFPRDYQWWITGFNYHMLDPHVNQMYMVTEINFSDSHHLQASNGPMKTMYKDFKAAMRLSQEPDSNYVVFDDKRMIAYIIWGNYSVEPV